MKKYILVFLLLLITYQTNACDQVFDWWILRYEKSYPFYDTWINWSNKNVYLNTFDIKFINPTFLDQWWIYRWTNEFKSNWYTVNSSSSMKVLETTSPNRKIVQHPNKRTNWTINSYDFGIEYTISYDYSNNYPDSSDDVSHKECVYYSVSWCWDWVLETNYWETCDPNDPSKIWWWTWGCDATCKPIITPPPTPTCDNLTASPTTWNTPFSSTMNCSWTNASSYSIDCWNWQTINWANWSCNYTTAWNYTARCTINWSITSASCAKTITATTVPPPSCNALNINPTAWTAPLTSSFNCQATNATSYKIEIYNWSTLINTINNNTWNYTFNTNWNYTARCTINWSITSTWCFWNITVSNIPPPTCQNWWVWLSQLSPISATTTWLCRVWETVWNFSSSTSWNTTNYTWSCNWITWWNCNASYTAWGWYWWFYCTSLSAMQNWTTYEFNCRWNHPDQYIIRIYSWSTLINSINNRIWTYTFPNNLNYRAQCYVWPNEVTSDTCILNLGWWGWWSGWNYCWDWILQRPNSSWVYEECDFGKQNPWPSWCDKNTCDINENTIPWWWWNTPDENTIPWWGNISIIPSWKMVVWDNMKIFSLIPNQATIRNTSTSYVYIDKKMCVYNKEKTIYEVITWSDMCSNNILGNIAPNWGYRSMIVPTDRFISNTDILPNNYTYADSEIITTFEWLKNSNSFLRWILEVRVAKPSISTLWWWAWTINAKNISNINKLSSWWFSNTDINNNLILTSLSENDPLSSFVKTVSWSSVKSSISKEWNKISNLKINTDNLNKSNITKLPETKYNWLDNVFIHKWDVNLISQNITWWNKTYIIDWNLTIWWDITSNNNILFVVINWWDIIIKNSVKNIDAILINMYWKVKWETTKTNDKLIINWALYSQDVSDIIAKRTYIKDRWEYIDVGTMINFTSKIFISPPPLLSTFLQDFLNTQKVAK